MCLLVIASFILWYLTNNWIFPEFNPFSYWNINGNFWESIIPISYPILIYAIFLGQLDWFSNEKAQDGTIISENIIFKGIISLFAGLFEELGHRGIFIWIGLIIISITNRVFSLIIIVLLIIAYISIVEKIDLEIKNRNIKLVSCGILLYVFIKFWILLKPILINPLHVINGLILQAYQWVVLESLILYIISFFLMALALLLIKRELKENRPINITLRLMSFVMLTVYVLPKGVSALSDLPIIPLGADKWLVLLYIGAVMWSNVKFRAGHKYQGIGGVLHSHVFGFYMIYIAFTFGLLYAIVIHFMVDLLIFLSEHVVQIIKNRGKISSY